MRFRTEEKPTPAWRIPSRGPQQLLWIGSFCNLLCGASILTSHWSSYNAFLFYWKTNCLLMKVFKRGNDNWTSICCVMSDKYMVERDVITEEIPNDPLLIFLFHVLRTFKREVSTDKLGNQKTNEFLLLNSYKKWLTQGQKTVILSYAKESNLIISM